MADQRQFVRIVAIALTLHFGVVSAQPARELAEKHHRRGVKLLTKPPRDIAAAEREFAAAYELDPDPIFMFNLALAQRLGGKCREAIETYRAYLRTEPPEGDATNAKIGIERCEQILASQRVVPEQPAKGESSTPKPVGEPQRSAASHPVANPSVQAGPQVSSPSPHWSGSALLVTGGVSAIASGTLYLLARRAGSSTFDAGPLAEHELQRNRAKTLQTASWITAGAAGVLVAAGGVIFFTTRPRARRVDIAVEPKPSGAAVVVGGLF